MFHYRVYAFDGVYRREFGVDYPTLEAARLAKASYAPHFPWCRYYIRKIGGMALGIAS